MKPPRSADDCFGRSNSEYREGIEGAISAYRGKTGKGQDGTNGHIEKFYAHALVCKLEYFS